MTAIEQTDDRRERWIDRIAPIVDDYSIDKAIAASDAVDALIRKTYAVTVVREVSTTYKFYVAPDETPHDAWQRYVAAVGVQNIIRHSEPRKL
jgi:hypothetical protein